MVALVRIPTLALVSLFCEFLWWEFWHNRLYINDTLR